MGYVAVDVLGFLGLVSQHVHGDSLPGEPPSFLYRCAMSSFGVLQIELWCIVHPEDSDSDGITIRYNQWDLGAILQ
jgi:hypothetical protein